MTKTHDAAVLLGRKGGKKNTPAQNKARRKNIRKRVRKTVSALNKQDVHRKNKMRSPEFGEPYTTKQLSKKC